MVFPPSSERTANQTNQKEWQSLVALFYATKSAFLMAVNLASQKLKMSNSYFFVKILLAVSLRFYSSRE